MRRGFALAAMAFCLMRPAAAAEPPTPKVTLAVIGACVDEERLREALLVEWGQKKSVAPSVLITCKGENIAVELYGHGRRSELEYPTVALPAEARERGLALLIAESESSLEAPEPSRVIDLAEDEETTGPGDFASGDAIQGSQGPQEAPTGTAEKPSTSNEPAEVPSSDFAATNRRETLPEAAPYVEMVEDTPEDESWLPKAVLFAGPLVRVYSAGGWLAGGNLTLGYGHAQVGVDITASDGNDVPSSDTAAIFGYAFLQERQRTFRPNVGLRGRVGITSAGSRAAGYVGGSLFGYLDTIFSSIMRLRLTVEAGHAGFSPNEDIKRIQGFFVATGLSLGATGGGKGL